MGLPEYEYYTYEDYKNWEGDWELINGIAFAMAPSPVRKHQFFAYEIAYQIRSQIEECKECEVLGEIDYKINFNTVVKPDVVLTCNEENEYLVKPPLIIVEIVSPSTAKKDEIYKFSLYESEGVKYYCLVYPDELVAKIYKLVDGKYKKEGVFEKEKYIFDEIECKIEIDFDKLFKRFRCV